MSAPALPLVLCTSEAEATFFTLPYVEELLQLSALVEAAVPPFVQLNRSSTAYMVRLRMERERGYEEQLYGHKREESGGQGNVKRGEEDEMALRLRPALTSSSSNAAMSPLWLLRVGLARALGLTVPAQDITDADAALGRTHLYSIKENASTQTRMMNETGVARANTCEEGDGLRSEAVNATGVVAVHECNSSSSDDDEDSSDEDDKTRSSYASGRLYGYRDSSGTALREMAVLEWFEDVLSFARQCHFSAVQTRCLLLNALGLLDIMQASHVTSKDVKEDVEAILLRRVHNFLQEQLRSQATVITPRVIEYETVCETVVQDRRDPDAVAALEQRMRKEKLNKKLQMSLREQLESLPSVATTTVQEKTMPVERVAQCGPFFTRDEAQAMTTFLCEGVARHWRLWQYCCTHSTCPSKEVTAIPTRAVMVVETVLRSGLPALSSFLPETTHQREVAREALCSSAAAALETLYECVFALPMAQTLQAMHAEQVALREAKERALQDNRANALVGDEYDRVTKAFTLRLEDTLLHNTRVGSVAAAMARTSTSGDNNQTAPSSPPSASLLPPIAPAATRKSTKAAATPKKTQGNAGVTRTAAAAGGGVGMKSPSRPSSALPSCAAQADSVVLPQDAVFELDAVEQRVERIATTVQRQLAEATATTTLGSAGGARRR